MAIGDLNPGYMGTANITGIGNFRFQDSSLAVTQEVNAPDLVMGDWDHDAWNYGPITVGGSLSGPMTENFAANGAWNWAYLRNASNCGGLESKDVELYYFCNRGGAAVNNSRTFNGMLVNSLQISCSAGDVATFSMDLLGVGASAWGAGTPQRNTTSEKLLTWDKVSVSVVGPGGGGNVNYSNFDVTIGNNLEAQYALSQADLFPFDIVPGMRSITGTLTVYNVDGGTNNTSWDDYLASDVATITINLNGSPIQFYAALHRIQPSQNPNVITSTLGFTGVTSQPQ